jgi:hypothetical protein
MSAASGSGSLCLPALSDPPQLALVHAPIHAKLLNQVEIYFSVVQRKVLSPNDFASLEALMERMPDFQYYWKSAAPRPRAFDHQTISH